ncbi:uncharacterized protein Cht6 isoform X6 [Panulirus ornatus]|uniref:uncharacterized protein Cht6 isoform X6 n=1 Tax=Panulirus ornatus TaxID=150431 RepID=UPI003A8A731B
MRFLLAAAAILAALAHSHEIEKRQAVDAANKVVCYYTNWSVYRKGLAKYTPQNINPYLCTHLVYAFGGLTDEFEIKPFDSYQDIEQGGYAKFNGLKQYNKGLKTLLAIGGWNEGSGRFSELVSLPEYRKTFIISAIKHLRRYNFDGLDLDWEYPASRDGSAPEDRENYATLVRELREAFDDEGSKVKQGPLLLTMAVPAGQNYIDKGYDIPSLTSDLDFFNILNYDYHSAYEPTVNHHAALMAAPGTSEYAWNSQLNVDWTVKYYISLGADKHKLVIGIPTYGRSYTLIDGNFTDFGASADGPGEQGKYTRENGFMAFYEVCENIASYGWDVRKPYPRRIGPYAYNEDQWVGYDDEKIVARKAEYVREQGLGGIMYWSLDNDDFRGICNGEQYPLVEAGKKALFSDEDIDVSLNEARALQSATGGARTPGSLSSRVQNRRRLTTTTSRPARLPATTSTPRGTLRRRRPGIRRGQRKQATTTTIDPLNTPAPPTTPSPVSGFSCKREGFYPNPDNCHKYYWCLDSGASGLGIVAHAFTCPSDLVFSKTIDGCDHPTRTKCSTEKKSRGGASATTPKPSSGSIPTTTEIPVDYSYLDDIYVDDEYYYDYEDSTPGDLPEPVEEVPNTVSRRLQNSGGNQFTRGSTSSKSSSSTSGSARETTSSSGSLGGRSRPQYTSISRDRSRTSQAAATDSSSSSSSSSRRQEPASTGGRRPEYTTIRRQRPAAQARPAAEEEVGQAREAEPTQGGGGGREYVVLERRRPQTSGGVVAPAAEVSAATPAPIEELYPTQPTLEYVTIDRSRGRITPDSPTPPSLPASEPTVSPAQGLVEIAPTSPRYVTIERGRFATEEEITTTTTEETTVVSDPAAAGATHDALPNEDYNYYDDEILTTETGSSDLTLPSSSPPPPPPPSSQTTTTTTSSTTTTTTSSPITTTTTTNERNTTITTAGRPTRTRTRLRGRPVGSQAKRLGASVDGVSRRTSNTQSRLPSKPLRNKTGGEKGKAERKEEVLKSTPGVLRRPPPRRPTGSSKNNRRRILVRKRIGVIGASGQAEQTTSGPVRIRTRPPTSPRTNPSRTFTRPRLPRPQLDDASLQPESRQRPSRPLIQISPRPSRPSADGPRVSRPSDRTRLTRPSADNPRATRPVDGPRPVRPEDDDTRPQLSTAAPVLSATASPVEVARDEEAVTTFDEESLSDTTVYPESTVRPTLASLFPKPQATTTPAPTTPAPTTPAPRTRSRPSPRTRLNPRPRATSPRPPPRSPRPQRPAFAKIPVTPPPTLKPAQSAILAGDYTDYYYDDLEGALTGTLGQLATLTEKAILMADGSVQCYDTGYFSHPDSCKKFISCSKTVRGLVRGWVYTCPQQLVFDPVGGMCNWAESVDCEGRK